MVNYHIPINMHIQYPEIASPAYVLEEKLLLNMVIMHMELYKN